MLTKEAIKEIEETLGYTFKSKELLTQAFTRSSYAEEERMHGGKGLSNEQLEFYGDSVLNYVVVTELAKNQAKVDKEGNVISRTEDEMSTFVSFWTDKNMLSIRMTQLRLNKYLLLSKGDQKQNVGNNKGAKEDLFEAILGAIWFDSGNNLELITKIVYDKLGLSFDDVCFNKKDISELREMFKKENELSDDLGETFIKNINMDDDGNFTLEVEDGNKSFALNFNPKSNSSAKNISVSDYALKYLDDNEILALKKRIDPTVVTEANAVQKLIQLFQLSIIKVKPEQDEKFDYDRGVWCGRVTLGDGSVFVSYKKTKAEARNEAALEAFKYAYDRAGNATKDGKLIEL